MGAFFDPSPLAPQTARAGPAGKPFRYCVGDVAGKLTLVEVQPNGAQEVRRTWALRTEEIRQFVGLSVLWWRLASGAAGTIHKGDVRPRISVSTLFIMVTSIRRGLAGQSFRRIIVGQSKIGAPHDAA